MTWTWTTEADGSVLVDKGDGQGPVRIDLGQADAATKRTEEWAGLAQKYADKEGIPLSWILGVIYSESGGNPSIASSDSVGAGLMQVTVTPPLFGLTREQALDPEANVAAGSHYLGTYGRKGLSLPEVASIFNAGPSASTGGAKTSSSDPWGLAETRPSLPYSGYIEKVVRASNYFLSRFPNGVAPWGSGTGTTQAGLGGTTGAKMLAFVAAAGAAYWLAQRFF